ncbi:MAG: hypothetical protein AB7V11_09260 [Pyrinomonadaceae bacterium]
MYQKTVKTKLIAIFLVLFVCLNGGGVLCVAYCQSAFESASAPPEHCPLKKKADHCDPDKSQPDHSVASATDSEMDCCPLTLSFVGGPIEIRSFSYGPTAILPLSIVLPEPVAFRVSSGQTPPSAYRGPPLDRRIERLKNCIIRI